MISNITERTQLEDHRAHLAAIVESSRDAIVGMDLQGVITSWNAGAEAMFGYSAGEMLGYPIMCLLPEDHDIRQQHGHMLESLRRGERTEILETRRLTASGVLIDVSITTSPIKDVSGKVVGAAKIARDITTHKAREREIARLSQLYAALSGINTAIVRTSGREELFRKVCRALVEQGGFTMAWIGWHQPEQQRLMPVAEYGDESAYLQHIVVYTDDRPEGQGPSGTAFRSGWPCVCNDMFSDPRTLPWRAELERRGVYASAALPVRVHGKVAGVLSVYSDQKHFFHDREVALLEEAAADLSFALDNFARDEARRHAEHRLHNEKQFSDTMVESMPGILYFYDDNGRFLRWNHNFETVSGYAGEEIARMHPLDFFADEDKPLLTRRIREVFDSGGSSVEAALVAKDGTRTPYFFTGRQVAFHGASCLVGVGIDISERKLAADLIADSERKYRELVEHANSIILRWNAEGVVTFLNEFGQRFFDYSATEICGRHVIGTIVPMTESGGRDLRELMADICSAPETFEQNINENMRRNGERVWIAWTNRIVRDAAGQVVEFLSIGTDITERKRAEAAHSASEARYRKLFDCAPDGILIADSSSYYLDANPAMCRMLGYRHDELLGLHASDIVVPAEVVHIDAALQAIHAADDHQREWRFRRKDGSIFDAEVIATLMPDGNLLGMIRDITDRKQAEAEREKRHDAEAADRIKSAFLATMSHELRTPLNSIIGFTGILLQGLAGPLNQEQNTQLDMVRSSARHLLALVNDVLDISKIEAGQLELACESFDLRHSITKVLALVRPQATAKGLALQVQLAPELGQVVSDERRFQQILLNLLSNAIKFTERGEVMLAAELATDVRLPAASSVQSVIRIRVSDTGIGIRQEDLQVLFQPFRQIDSGLTRNHDGTGLGLAICQRIATLMGGYISVESESGAGSTFTVTLPLQGSGA